jgi:hypothetical protein
MVFAAWVWEVELCEGSRDGSANGVEFHTAYDETSFALVMLVAVAALLVLREGILASRSERLLADWVDGAVTRAR